MQSFIFFSKKIITLAWKEGPGGPRLLIIKAAQNPPRKALFSHRRGALGPRLLRYISINC